MNEESEKMMNETISPDSISPESFSGELTTTQLSANEQALAIIDKALSEMLHRELVSTNEVADLLLDLRSLLAASPVLVQN